MPPTKTYKTKDGVYDIPDEKAKQFIEQYPDAMEVKSFVNAKDTFDIPIDKVEVFKQQYPTAKPLFEETQQPQSQPIAENPQQTTALVSKVKPDPAQPIPQKDYQLKNADKLKLLAPELHQNAINAQGLAKENTLQDLVKDSKGVDRVVTPNTAIDINAANDEKTGISGALADVDRFSNNLIGRHTDLGYVGADGQPLTHFKEGDILAVPKDKKMDDGNIYPTGFIQLTQNANGVQSWRGVSAPDPTFQIAKQPLQDVVVTGYKKKAAGSEGFTPDLVDGQTDNTDDYNHMVDMLRKKDSDIDDVAYFDGVSKLGASKEVNEALHNNYNSEGSKRLPWWLLKNKEVLLVYDQIIKDRPTYNSTSNGSFKALQDAVVKTYDLDKPSQIPLESGSPVFYEMVKKSNELQPSLQQLEVLKGAYENEADAARKEAIGKKISTLATTVQPQQKLLQDYFQKPEIKEIVDLADKQQKGFAALSQVNGLFPNRQDNEEKKFKAQHEDLSALQKVLNPIKSIYYGAKQGVNELVDFTSEKISALGGWSADELRQQQRTNDQAKQNAAANDYVKKYDSSKTAGDIGNFINSFGSMLGSMAPAIPIGGSTTLAKVGTSLYFGATAAQSTINEYREQGLSEGTANLAGLTSGAAMALITYGLGGKADLDGFRPSFKATQMLLDPALKDEGAKLLSKEVLNYKGGKFIESLGSSTKSAAEMKLAGIINAGVNGLVNNKYGTDLNTDTGNIGDFLSNVLSFNLAHHAIGVFNEGQFTPEKKTALINYAATGNMKAAIDGINELLRQPGSDKNQLRQNRSMLEDFAGLSFPKGITAEQKTLLYLEHEKKQGYQEAIEKSDFPEYYKNKVKEADNNIAEILSNPAGANGQVQKIVKPVMEQVKEATSNPLGLPKEPESAMVVTDPTVRDSRTVEPIGKEESHVEPVQDVTIGEVMEKPVTYKGQNGILTQDGQTVIFRTNDGKREYEIGNSNEIKDSPTSDFGVTHEQSVVSVNEDNNLTVRGTPYKNLYSDPLAAINKDSEGNIVSVNLETADGGKKRTFRGNVAEDLAYNLHLQELNKNNETRKRFETYFNEEPAAREEINNGRLSEIAEKSTVTDNAPVRRIQKEESQPVTIENPTSSEPITEEHLRDAKYNVEVARRKLEKTEAALSKTHATQSGMFDATQKGMFAASADEAKTTLEPLRNDYKTAKADLEELQRKFDVQSKAANPDIFDNTKVVRKSTQKGGDAKATYSQIDKMDEPTTADEAALHYLAGGGKVAESSVNNILGSTKRATLNSGKPEAKTSEVKARDYVSKDGKTIDEISHSLWDNLPEHLQDKITTEDLRNSLEEHISGHNTRLSAATELKDRYLVKPVEKLLTKEESKVMSSDDIAELHDIIDSLPQEQMDELVAIIEKYTDNGVLNWERLQKDSNDFDSDLLISSYQLKDIVNGLTKQEKQNSGSNGATSKNGGEQKIEEPGAGKQRTEGSGQQNIEGIAPSEEIVEQGQSLTQRPNSGRIKIEPITGQTPRRTSEVMADLASGFKQRIIYSKSKGRNVAGSYNTGDTGIKLTFGADLDVASHEIGHSFDDKKGILTSPSNVIKTELKPFEQYGSTPPKNHPKPDAYRLAEGFAEWVRAYIVNPDAAKKAAPETFKVFDNALTDKERSAIEKYSNDVRVLAGADGLDRIIAQMDAEDRPTNILKQVAENLKKKDGYTITWADRLRANFTNPFRAMDKAVDYAKGLQGFDELVPSNDPILLSRLLLGFNGRFDALMNHGLEDATGKTITDNKGNPKTLNWLLENLDNSSESAAKLELKKAEAYMIAERTVELSKRFQREHVLTGIGGGLFSDVEAANDAVKAFKNLPQEQQDRLQITVDRYREMADIGLQYMVDKGRMSQEAYDQIKADNLQYVAMKRVMDSGVNEEISAFKPNTAGGVGSKKEVIKKITGSSKEIVSPFISLVDNLHRIYRESDRNDIMVQFRDLLVNNRGMNDGDPKNFAAIGIKVPESNAATLPIFIKGKVEHWQFDPELKKSLTGLDGVLKSLPKAITIIPSTLRWMVTHFPAFAARNFVRDLQDRLIKSSNSGITDLVGDKKNWQEVAQRGGLNAGHYFSDRASYEGLLNESIHELSKNKTVVIANPIKAGKYLWSSYTKLLEKSETVNRVAEYRGSFNKAKERGMTDFDAQLYAAGQTREMLDFAMMGHYMKIINQLVPFSNAAVQGLRTDAKRLIARPATFAARLAIYSVIPQIAIWFLNHSNKEDGDEYETLPAYQRDLYWNYKIGANNWLAIPKPYELSLPAATVDRMLSKIVYSQKDAYEGFDGTVARSLIPIDEAAMAGPLKTVVEIMANHDFFRDKSIIPPYETNLDLALRKTQNASRLGKVLQELVGIDARNADYMVINTFAAFGKSALSLFDLGRKDSHFNFSVNDLGFTKNSPAYNSKDVQNMLDYAKRYGLGNKMKPFSNQLEDYFAAETSEQKDVEARKLVEVAKHILEKWKANGTGEKKVKKALATQDEED